LGYDTSRWPPGCGCAPTDAVGSDAPTVGWSSGVGAPRSMWSVLMHPQWGGHRVWVRSARCGWYGCTLSGVGRLVASAASRVGGVSRLGRVTLLPLRSDLRGLEPYGAPQLDVPHPLNVNENPYAPTPEVASAITAAVTDVVHTLNRYPDRDFAALRSDLAGYLAAEPGVEGL